MMDAVILLGDRPRFLSIICQKAWSVPYWFVSPIVSDEHQSPTIGLPEDTNFVIVSAAALEYFEHTFISSEARRSFLDVIKYSKTEAFCVTDKHHIEHQAHFVEASRFVAINPPWPKNLHERLEQLNDIYNKI